MFKEKKIGLALSGGGARGIAHIGVLKALKEHGIEADYISGASAGAIVGAMYAAGLSIEEMLEIVAESSLFRAFKLVIPNKGLTSLSYLRDKLAEVIKEDDFSALSKPLFIAVSNLNKGLLEIKNSGRLFDVVTASSSVPLIFKPVEIEGQIYVDGGLFSNLPVEPLRALADYIIGVNVMPTVEVENKSLNGWLGIAARCFELSIHANSIPQEKLCDQLIEIKEVVKYNIFQFSKHEEIAEMGYRTAMENMDQLLADLSTL